MYVNNYFIFFLKTKSLYTTYNINSLYKLY
nr:MAG TPA: hypothetical protein [Caudoviricetes sp.]